MAFIGRALMRNIPAFFKEATKQQQQQQSFTRIRLFHQTVPLLKCQVQRAAPDFKGLAVVGTDFQEIQLSDYRGKYLVLFFYPLDFTFVCPTELISFSKHVEDFRAIDAEIVGVSVDSHFSHLAWLNAERQNGGLGGLDYPLLSDLTKKISTDYGVLLENEGISLRGTFIIDPNGILRQLSINDLPVGRSVEEVLRLVKAFQFADKHGEVCPANWNPETNPDTIKPDVKASRDYFKTHN